MSVNAPEESQGSSFNIGDILWSLKRRAYLFVLFTALGAAASYAFLEYVPPSYKASTRMVYNPGTEETLSRDTGLAPAILSRYSLQREISLIQSRPVTKAALEKLKQSGRTGPQYASAADAHSNGSKQTDALPFLSGPAANDTAGENVASNIDVETSVNSQIVTISYTSADPQRAAAVVNALAEAFIEYHIQSRFDSVNNATQWLRERLAESRANLIEADKDVETYKAKHALTSTEGGSIHEQQIANLNHELSLARSSRSEAEVRLHQTEEYLKEQSGDYAKLAGIIDTAPMEALRTSLIETERKEAAARTQFGSSHPSVKDALAELQTIRRRIAAEAKRHILVLKNALKVALSKERSLSKDLDKLSEKVADLRQASIKLRQLERERDSIKSHYESMLRQVKQTSEQLTLKSSGFRVLESAEPPQQPKIKAAFVWAGGPAAGFMLAFGLIVLFELLRSSVKDRSLLEQKLGVPTLTIVPQLHSRDLRNGRFGVFSRKDRSLPYRYASMQPNSLYADCLRSALVAIDAGSEANKLLMVTSPLPQEGKTQVALNMAYLSAAAGQKTLFLDLDLRKRATSLSVLSGEEGPDLVQYLNDPELGLEDITRSAHGIDIIPSQRLESDLGAVIASQRLNDLLTEASEKYDRIWIDTAPAGVFADARFLAKRVDGTILVVKWRRTPSTQAAATADFIHRSGGRLLGTIINGIEVDSTVAYGMTVYEHYYR